MTRELTQRVRFDLIRYANCWEDASILSEALEPAGKRILSIASGGDNCFALLAAGADVVAADLSAAQLACVALKREAIRVLDREPLLGFLGIGPAGDRREVYARQLRGRLPPEAQAFWDAHPEAIARGIVHAGKFEAYFQCFRRRVLPFVHRRATVAALLQPRDGAGRRRFYEREWNTWRWRLLFRLFFSRFVMGRLGRDPEFFRFVEGSVAARILARTEHALTALSTHDNPYLSYILAGNFGPALPPYLEPAAHAALRVRLDRLTLHHGGIEDAAQAHAGPGFDGFNLSDIFEYLPPEVCESLYAALLAVARPGARFAYWNMLVPRTCPASLAGRVRPLEELAARLFERDRAFFYRRFIVEEVRP